MMNHGMTVVHINPHHVKKSKELDENSQNKTDQKDPKVIAGLVIDGRYSMPYLPEGVYAELRGLTALRLTLTEDSTRIRNRIQRWLSIYFPEYKTAYPDFGVAGSLLVLQAAPLPSDVVRLGSEGLLRLWKGANLRGSGIARATALLQAAATSIGRKEPEESARMELRILLSDYRQKQEQRDPGRTGGHPAVQRTGATRQTGGAVPGGLQFRQACRTNRDQQAGPETPEVPAV